VNREIIIPKLIVGGLTRQQRSMLTDAMATHRYGIIFRDPHGRVISVDVVENLVTTAGLNKYLDATLKTGLTSPAWYLLLTDGTPTVAAGDTMASHAGWTEVTAYSEAARQAWTPGTISAGSVDNSGSVATFTVSADNTTIGGAGLVDVSTKGGATGTLLGVGAFTGGDQILDTGSTIDITATFTQAAA
jgi:hypothetical protein